MLGNILKQKFKDLTLLLLKKSSKLINSYKTSFIPLTICERICIKKAHNFHFFFTVLPHVLEGKLHKILSKKETSVIPGWDSWLPHLLGQQGGAERSLLPLHPAGDLLGTPDGI